MNRRDLRITGWVCIAGFAVLGVAMVLAASLEVDSIFTFDTGLGTSLLLVAASILFIAVLATPRDTSNSLVIVATWLTAAFGYLGTFVILFDEEPVLSFILLAYTLYLLAVAQVFHVVVRLVDAIFVRFRR